MRRPRSCFLDALAAAAAVADDGVVVVAADAAVEVAVAHVAVDDDEEELAGFEAAHASPSVAADAVVAAGADAVAERGSGLEKVERQVQLQAFALQRNLARCCCNRSQRKYPVAFRAVVPQQARQRALGS